MDWVSETAAAAPAASAVIKAIIRAIIAEAPKSLLCICREVKES